MSRPKKQHFVPVLHLKHFVGENPPRLVWTYDMRGAEPRLAVPEETGLQTNFYSVKDVDGKHVDILETWLSGVEGKAAPIYEQLLKGIIPTGQDRADFSVFLSSSYVRSPRLINQYAENYGKFVQMITRFTAEKPERFENMLRQMEAERGPVDPKVRVGLRDYILDTSRYTVNVNRTRGLEVLGISDELQMLLYSMKWTVLGSDREKLITSDGPVSKFSPSETRTIFGDGGFKNKRNIITYPLSPSRCLLLRWDGEDGQEILGMPREMVRWCNHERAHSALRYLYSSVRDDGIRRLGEKYKNSGPGFITSFDDKVAEVTISR